jgi:3-oxoacyl-[acyl-carrier-protein] synthase III
LTSSSVYIVGSASAFGSRLVPSEEVDHAFGMPSGKLKTRAGILSFAHVAENEDEGSLGMQACTRALQNTGEQAKDVDWILAASETHHAYPSLSAILHAKLGLRENCNALDVGSGCLGLLQALAVAQAFLASGRGEKVLVATARA